MRGFLAGCIQRRQWFGFAAGIGNLTQGAAATAAKDNNARVAPTSLSDGAVRNLSDHLWETHAGCVHFQQPVRIGKPDELAVGRPEWAAETASNFRAGQFPCLKG